MRDNKNKQNNIIKIAYERKNIRVIDSKRVDEAELEIDKLHGDNGFIIFAVKDGRWQQYSFKKEDISNKFLLNLLGLNVDTYITMNSFRTPRRLMSNLYSLNCLWADLDYYKKKKYKDYTYKEMIEVLEEDKFIKENKPSFYIASGQGIYPIWLIQNAYAEACLPIWGKLMDIIHENLKKYGADPRSLDATRVLRLAGSNHTGVNKKAVIVKDCLEKDFKRYTIPELADRLLPKFNYTKEEWIKVKEIKRKTRKLKESIKVTSLFTVHSLNFARMKDLQTLVELRKFECDGKREMILFLYRYWGNCFWKDNEIALEETLEFNKMFNNPCNQDTVERLTKRAEVAAEIWEEKINEYWALEDKPPVKEFFKKTGAYIYSNKKLIQVLEITQEEMKSLSTIFNTKEKNRRNADYRKKWKRENDAAYDRAKRRNENGLTKREQAKVNRINTIIELKAQGLNQSKIAEKLGITRQAVSKLVKEINNVNEYKVEFKPGILNKVTDSELSLLG